ncbi:MAG: NADH-quinone oxidoreductase subunit J [Halococcoides sp.]
MGGSELFAFALFAVVTLGGAVGVVVLEELWHAALSLGVALLAVAVLYLLAGAPLVAAIQVLVYVGGVLILISFAVMLTDGDRTIELPVGGES